jgi:hypothetical protein
MKESGVEFAAKLETALLVPTKRRAVKITVTREQL